MRHLRPQQLHSRPQRNTGLRRVAVVAAAASLVAAAVAGAQPRQTAPGPAATAGSGPAATSAWDEAANAFRYQDFDTAIAKLRALLYPKPQLDPPLEWRAREYLGAALWWTGRKQEALDEFTALLVRNPPARLDPASYPPQMIQDFETLRGNLLRLGVLRPGQKPVAAPEPPQAWVAPLPLVLFPLGVGQFANDEVGKGVAFLASQAALGGTSLGLYLYNRDEGQQARTHAWARTTQVATGAAFWAVVAWGVVDAWWQRGKIADAVAAARRQRAAAAP